MSDLMQKLAISKKIMDVHNNIQRGTASPSMPMVENFDTPAASYNIPQEYLSEVQTQKPSYDPSQPLDEVRIKNSKLPDEIKKLMIEQPIIQPNSMGGGSVISDDIIEGAQRLMNLNSSKQTPTTETTQRTQPKSNESTNINLSEMKSMLRDVVRDTVRDVVREELQEAGMLVESTSKSNDTIQFKVGSHLFIGKVTQVKKIK